MTILLRLAAPLQSWGVGSKFDRRGTERVPTKSGVIGLCAAAIGISRENKEKIHELSSLKFGVRVDRPGVLLRDYHTAKSGKTAYVTNRYYLADAKFTAGLEGVEALLHDIDAALRRPAFPLFLGRRSCPPEGKVALGIVKESLLDALRTDAGWEYISYDGDGVYLVRDVPVSFSQIRREYGFRCVEQISAEKQIGEIEDEIDWFKESEMP
ncbi:MAG: type I-E CRISPR-associated protein Cas5/CasD [Oscillospiraceae bacterium]|jgi:CRISPR system Cascade subunit CasD|nr:type I-E CRISPR-associated protein Cas5/CasD [Oscillospiraceae bacterium]